jgi:uncharacterized hydrophobic protein (TIGR00271 family)
MDKSFIIITNEQDNKRLLKEEADLFKEHSIRFVSDTNITQLQKDDSNIYFLYLSDEATKAILPDLIKQEIRVAFLPHPKGPATIKGYGVPSSLREAFNYIINNQELMKFDLLTCNNIPVLNAVSVGRSMNFITNRPENIFKRFINFFIFLKNISSDLYKLIIIDKGEESKLETVGTDILIVQHAKNASISKLLVKNNRVSPKLFHAFFFAPRSIMQLISAFTVKSLFGRNQQSKKFNFYGHIKDKNLRIQFSQPTEVKIDHQIEKVQELNLSTIEGFQFYASELINNAEVEHDNNKRFLVDQLPKGEVRDNLAKKRLPLIRTASTEEYKDLFNQLRENAKPKQTYLVLMMLSTILATFGLFSNSSPVIIGAMILAPLMSPIISLSMGVLRQDRNLIRTSLTTVGIGIGVGYAFAIIITVITPIMDINDEIALRTNPNIIDLGIAVISGAAGAYAHAKEEIAKTLAGVAIAVALVPPLAVSGIGIGWMNWQIFFGAFLLLLTNLTGMVLAGSLVFLLSGYSPLKLARKGLLISFFVVSALSIPLGYGFIAVVQENRIIQSLNHQEINEIEIKNVKVISVSPLKLSVTLLSDHNPTSGEIQQIKNEIELILEKEVILHIEISLIK